MNNWDEYDIYEGMSRRDKQVFKLILCIFILFCVGIFSLMLVYFEFKEYNDIKKSGDWIVCEARYVGTTCEEVVYTTEGKINNYIHHFEYEAPDGKIYEHLEKNNNRIKKRVSYELIVKINCNYPKSRMKPYEASGIKGTFRMGIGCLIVAFIDIIIFYFRRSLIE